MNLRNIISILTLLILIFVSCEDAANNLGKEIRPISDDIIVRADTFHLSTETYEVDHIISRPDSFLLGKFNDPLLGITSGEILAELKLFKDGYTFLDESVAVTQPDSVVMSVFYSNYFGSMNSPLHLQVYELKEALSATDIYMSDIDPAPFVDYTKLIGDTTFTVLDGNTGKMNTEIRFKMKEDFMNRFFTTDPAHYLNQEAFRNFFKGVFITTDYFGSATMLNVQYVRISLYYNYAYKTDLSYKINGRKDFYAGPEVRKINRVLHPLRKLTFSPSDEFNYVTSPANYYTRVRIPLGKIRQDVKIEGKRLAVNSASIKMNVEKKVVEDRSAIPYVSSLLLIKQDSVDNFFKNRKLISDNYAFLALRDSVYVDKDNYKYEYNFNGLSKLIEKEIKNPTNSDPYLDLVLIPVTPKFTQTSATGAAVSEIIQSNLMQSVKIFSGQHKDNPMTMEVVYSGF
ncbi:MAG: DUF4270 domain-containing protein [Porphyromonadaceae bacterium]|nr:DUF4270 domain-containing protein [Porphyromonadaceae bacterium]